MFDNIIVFYFYVHGVATFMILKQVPVQFALLPYKCSWILSYLLGNGVHIIYYQLCMCMYYLIIVTITLPIWILKIGGILDFFHINDHI